MNLKEIRKRRGWTQEQLETASGVDQPTISAIETGRIKSPGWQIIGRLAAALDVRPEELFPITAKNNNAA